MLNPVKNYSHSKQMPVANRLSVFQSPDDDEEEDYEQWLEIKSKLHPIKLKFTSYLFCLQVHLGYQ